MDLFTFLSAVASYLDETTGLVICRPVAERLRGQDLPVPPTCIALACRGVAERYLPESEAVTLPDEAPGTVGSRLLQMVHDMDPQRYAAPPGRAEWQSDQGLQIALHAAFSELALSLAEKVTGHLQLLLSVWGTYMTRPEAIKVVACGLRDLSDNQQKLLVCQLVREVMRQTGPIVGTPQVMRWGQTMLDPLNITAVSQALTGHPTAEQERLLRRFLERTSTFEEPLEPEGFAAIVRRSAAN